MVNIKRLEYNFSLADLTRVLVTLWSKDEFFFIPGPYRLQFTSNFRV
jgi:hypothetical protein